VYIGLDLRAHSILVISLNHELIHTYYRCLPKDDHVVYGKRFTLHAAEPMTMKGCQEMSNRKTLDKELLPEGKKDTEEPIVVTGVRLKDDTKCDYITTTSIDPQASVSCSYVYPGENYAKLELEQQPIAGPSSHRTGNLDTGGQSSQGGRQPTSLLHQGVPIKRSSHEHDPPPPLKRSKNLSYKDPPK